MQLKKRQQLYKKKYGNNYKKYSLEPIKNKYGKIIEYKIIESKYKNRNNVEMVFTRKNGSYATKCLRNGVEIKDVADILGHKRIETTENYYISSTAENKNDVTTVFDKVMTSELINNIIKYDIAY